MVCDLEEIIFGVPIHMYWFCDGKEGFAIAELIAGFKAEEQMLHDPNRRSLFFHY